MDKNDAKAQISSLIERYKEVAANREKYKTTNEETTKNRFIEPLFVALGWDIENKNQRDEVTFEYGISKGRVDYGFKLDGVFRFLLEAKALKENLERVDFIKQAIDYAYNKKCTWAVLTDFESVRIYNATIKTKSPAKSHFLTLRWNEYLEKFDSLWLLSREAFEKGILDKEAERDPKPKKAPIDKQLLHDFTVFRRLLSNDISKLNQGKKSLTPEDLDEAVQRILDRLIFIRYCEDKELEPLRLINLREHVNERQGQVAKALRDIFELYNNNYDSKIFRPHLCDSLEIDNAVLYDVIEGLYTTKDGSISYDFSAIEADMLGTIYEQYLGHVLKKTEKRATLTKDQTRRKEHGVYYTPTQVVGYIVKNTIGKLLENGNNNSKHNKLDKIRILDPAAGSGSFLIKAFDVLNSYYATHDKDYDQTKLDTSIEENAYANYGKKLEIVQNHIFGVDLDRQAVEVAQLNLLLKLAEKGRRLPLLQQNIKEGNSLIDSSFLEDDKPMNWSEEFPEVMANGGFDIIIGNPPYGAEISEGQKEFIKKNYKSATGRYDSYYYFIEKGIHLLKDGGLLGFIVPDTWLTNLQTQNLREIMLSRCSIVRIVSLPQKVFPDANVDTCIVILKKESDEAARLKNKVAVAILDKDADLGNLLRNTLESEFMVMQKNWLSDKRRLFNIYQSTSNSLVDKIKKDCEKDCILLGKISEMTRGINPYAKSELIEKFGKVKGTQIVKNRIWHSDTKKGSEYKKELVGSDIGRYSLHWKSGQWIRYGQWLSRPRDPKFFTFPHLVVQRIRNPKLKTRIVATFVDPKHEYYNNSGLTNITIIDKAYSIKYVLAILNSKLMNWYYRQFFRDVNIKPEDLRELPIKKLDFEAQKPLIDLVDKMLTLNEKLVDFGSRRTDERATIEDKIKKVDEEIECLVYRLYNIAPEEEKVIEASFK